MLGKTYYYVKHGKEKLYKVTEIIKYKDENTNGSWIDIVVYVPLYECEIDKFSRSKTMFLDTFKTIE